MTGIACINSVNRNREHNAAAGIAIAHSENVQGEYQRQGRAQPHFVSLYRFVALPIMRSGKWWDSQHLT